MLPTAAVTINIRGLRAAALAWLLCVACGAWAGSSDEPPADSRKHDSTGESHAVRDSLVTGADKVGSALKKGAEKVGPAIDRGVSSTRKAVEKSADTVSTALKKTSKKINEEFGSGSGDDKPAKSGAK